MPAGGALHGRDDELARLAELLAGARRGRSAALLVTGEPGIGKTALLAEAVRRAEGLRVLRGQGFESERDIPFAGLYGLLAPLLALRERIPPVQARALGTALAVEPPAPHDPFAVPVGVLSLLSAAAEEGPILAVVDDLHWLDQASLQAVVFAARRLDAEGIVMLLGARDDPALAPSLAGLPRMHLGPLEPAAARALLREGVPRRVTDAVVEQLLRTAGGNPLALRELPEALSAAELAGEAPLAVRLPRGSSVEQGFRHRLAGLDEPARRALAVVAALEAGPLELCLAALERLGLGAAALEAGESAGLLRLERDEVSFRHPLLRALAYGAASGADRRAAHRAVAELTTDPAVRAWQLSAAALGPDEEAAAALDAVAVTARRRGAPGAAAAAALRAAELSASDEARLPRLLAAAADLASAGRGDEALVPLERAARLPATPAQQGELRTLRGRVEIRRGAIPTGRALLVAEARRRAAADPVGAAALHLEAGVGDLNMGDSPGMMDNADRARALAEGRDTDVVALASLLRATALVPIGRGQEAEPLFAEAEPLLLHGDPLPAAAEVVAFSAQVAMWLDRADLAEAVLARQIDAARAASAVGRVVFPLTVRSHLNFRRGRWAQALVDADEGLRLARETGQVVLVVFALAALARVEAGRGEVERALAHAGEAGALTDQLGSPVLRIYAETAHGAAALAGEQLEEAAEHLLRAEAGQRALGGSEPAILQFDGDLLEALVRAGRPEEAQAELARLQAQADHTRRPWAHAVAERVRGILAPEDAFPAHFARALEWHARGVEQPFEIARTRLAHGERLRRAGQRIAARAELEPAADAFARLGAAPWLERTRAELAATGRTLRARREPQAEELTPSELQVALRVAEGLTNREVAAAIFVSPKTVEHHLSSIYRKLGIRSRTELARRLAASPSALTAA